MWNPPSPLICTVTTLFSLLLSVIILMTVIVWLSAIPGVKIQAHITILLNHLERRCFTWLTTDFFSPKISSKSSAKKNKNKNTDLQQRLSSCLAALVEWVTVGLVFGIVSGGVSTGTLVLTCHYSTSEYGRMNKQLYSWSRRNFSRSILALVIYAFDLHIPSPFASKFSRHFPRIFQ